MIAGRYEVVGKLASGGMASVYLATMRLARGLSRRVALKRVHPHLAEDPRFVTMFVDEARLASELSHPGIVPVLDALEAGGELILVLEYVAGWDLESILRGNDTPVDPAIALRIARMGLETLAYVHGATDQNGRALDIVHRDVSPSNVLVGEDDSVRLLDFGIAKAARRSVRTATRTLKGKLAYMSPEQASGDPLDGRADVYAMGLTLLEMLLGRRINQGDDTEVLRWARSPQLPATDALDASVRDAILRLLEPDVSKRPHADDAARLIARLETPGSAEITRAWVLERMGCAARPLADRDARKRSVDAALAALLDEDDENVTAVPAPTPARSLLRREESVADTPTREERPARVEQAEAPPRPTRRGALFVLAGVLVVGVGVVVANPFASVADAPEEPTEPTEPILPAFVNVATTPPAAAILVGGEARGTTPSVLELGPDDPHELTLRRDDYADANATFEPVPGGTVDVSVALSRLPARLVVRSDPEGATVLVDGQARGETPLELTELARETMQLSIEMEGHRTETREVDLDAEREVELEVELRAIDARPGTLWVNANVPNARVEVDGRVVSQSVPWRGSTRAGSRRVTVRAPDGRSDTRTVRVRAGEVARAGFFL